MINKLIGKFFCRRFSSKGNSSIIQQYIEKGSVIIDDSANFKNLSVKIRQVVKDKIFLTVGKDSIVNGTFVFENENGSVKIGDRTFVGNSKFISINSITIGNDVLISWDCTFMDNNAHPINWSLRKSDVLDWKKGVEEGKIGYYKNWEHVEAAPIVIKDKVWVGFDAVILKGVTIGEGAIIAARSVVTKDVDDWTIVAGNPAKVVREIPLEER